MTSKLLTVENARWLVDELDLLVRTSDEHDVSPAALETASRLITSLEQAPIAEPALRETLARLQAWSEVMFGDADHAGPGSVKSTMLDDLADLRERLGPGPPP